jgi:phosphoglycerate dehydrogenase-like enzyme
MPDDRWRFVVTEGYSDAAIDALRRVGDVVRPVSTDEAALCAAVADADALLVRTHARVTARVIDAGRRLRVIGRGGVGLDNVDVEHARLRGIPVVYTPAASTDAVADLTVGLLIALVRRIPASQELLRGGRFVEARALPGDRELAEMTLGIVGLGRIGRAVARRCVHGFGMSVVYNDIAPPGELDFAATPMEKDELYAASDAVTLHVPLTDLTRKLISAPALSRFKPGALLINTARGPILDAADVAHALHDGQLGGAAIDVFDDEPPPVDHPLMHAPNALLTPHIASRTQRALAAMNDVVDDVLRVLRGETPRYPA